jgi:hypothetical protein
METILLSFEQLGNTTQMHLQRTRHRPSLPGLEHIDRPEQANPLSLLSKPDEPIPLSSARLGSPKKYALQPSLWMAPSVPPMQHRHKGLHPNG